MPKQVVLGLDPGGAGRFGWCILEDSDRPPLRFVDGGVVDHARAAVGAFAASLTEGDVVCGAGIDAPLFWSPSGDRQADRIVRTAVRQAGAPSPGGTVQAVNSLRGACLTQGVMVASLIREYWHDLPITEAHPKAYLWVVGSERPGTPAGATSLAALPEVQLPPTMRAHNTDHERDAAIAAFCAWAMLHDRSGWRDLAAEEGDGFFPVPQPLKYWFPPLTRRSPRS